MPRQPTGRPTGRPRGPKTIKRNVYIPEDLFKRMLEGTGLRDEIHAFLHKDEADHMKRQFSRYICSLIEKDLREREALDGSLGV